MRLPSLGWSKGSQQGGGESKGDSAGFCFGSLVFGTPCLRESEMELGRILRARDLHWTVTTGEHLISIEIHQLFCVIFLVRIYL